MRLPKAFHAFSFSLVVAGATACGLTSNSANVPASSVTGDTKPAVDAEGFGLSERMKDKALSKIKNNCEGKDNLKKALDSVVAIDAMKSQGLLQGKAKCEKISEAVQFLKETKKPQPRPFCGMRDQLRKDLERERKEVLKQNGVVSCKSMLELAASLPAPTPCPVTPSKVDVTPTPSPAPGATPAPQPSPIATANATATATPPAVPTQPAALVPEQAADEPIPAEDLEDAE